MQTTKVFKSGNSLAVRLPKQFSIKSNIVQIFKRDGDIIIRERPENLAKAYQLLIHFTEDFFSSGRKDLPPQKREF